MTTNSDDAADMRDLYAMAKDEEFSDSANKFLLSLKRNGHKDFSNLTPKQRKWVDDLVLDMQKRG